MSWDDALQYVRDTMGQSKIDVFTHLAGGDVVRAEEATAAFERAYSELIVEEGVEPIPGARELLEDLRDADITVVLTTGFAPVTRDALRDLCRARGLLTSTTETTASRGTQDGYRGRLALVVGLALAPTVARADIKALTEAAEAGKSVTAMVLSGGYSSPKRRVRPSKTASTRPTPLPSRAIPPPLAASSLLLPTMAPPPP